MPYPAQAAAVLLAGVVVAGFVLVAGGTLPPSASLPAGGNVGREADRQARGADASGRSAQLASAAKPPPPPPTAPAPNPADQAVLLPPPSGTLPRAGIEPARVTDSSVPQRP